MDWIGSQPNSSLGYCANKTKQDQIQLTGWNYLHNNQRLLEEINDKGISKLTIAKKRWKITHPGWFKKDKPVTRSGNSDGGGNKIICWNKTEKKNWQVQEK